jgi:phosphoglycolate phosphatase
MLVVFDFDGTLADTYALFRLAFNDAARELNVTPYRTEDEAHIRMLEAADVLRYHGVGSGVAAEFVGLLRKGMEARRDEARLFPGISDVLLHLVQEGQCLALLSSNSPSLIQTSMGQLTMHFPIQRFDVPLGEKASVLRKVSDAKSSQVCFIGDEIRDASAATEADVPFGAVCWGYNSESALRKAGAVEILHHPSDIERFVRNLSTAPRQNGRLC